MLARPMTVPQRHEDLAVEGTDDARVAVRKVDAAVRDAEIVEYRLELVLRDQLADGDLDRIGDACRLFDARACRRTEMQANLAGVDAREEVAPEHRIEQTRKNREREERHDERPAPLEQRRQHERIRVTHARELRIEA